MGVGFISLISTGLEDLYLIGDPQITFFKVMYRRTTEFSMADYEIKINGDPQPGSTHMINITPIGDKLNRISLIVDVPTPELLTITPTVSNIEQIGNKYNLNLTVQSTKPSDPVDYNKLFNDDPTSVGSQITTATKNLNTEYNSRLDVLSYYANAYSTSNDRHIGKYIAIEASGIDWSIFGTNIDCEGYVLLTPQKTRELFHSPDKILNFTEKSFMYYPDQTADRIAIANTIDTTNLSSPIDLAVPATPTRMLNIDRLMKVYPRMVSGYTQMSTLQDFLNITDIDTSRYHMMISINYLRQVQQRNIYIRRVYLNALDTIGSSIDTVTRNLEAIKDTNLSNIIQQSIIFNNFDINMMMTESSCEKGFYLFNVNPNVSDANYPTALMAVLDAGRIKIPTNLIDSSTTDIGIEFNQYDINENASYDPLWEISEIHNIEPALDLNGVTSAGFLLVNIADIASNPSSQKVMDIGTINTLINPRYISSNCDRIGFAPYKITRVWKDSIVKNITLNNQLISQNKVTNLIDGITTLVKLFGDFYSIPHVINSFNMSSLIQTSGLSIQSLNGLHSLLVAMMEDTMNTQNQARNYCLQDIQLHNSSDIKNVIYDKLIRGIIYVDQSKLGFQIDINNLITPFVRKKIFTNLQNQLTLSSDVYDYLNSTSYIYTSRPSDDPTIDAMATNRNIVYGLSKYILWSYYLENIYPLYDPNIDNTSAITSIITKLSYMLLQVPINPIGTDPNTGLGTADTTTQNVRFASNDITDITRCIIYDDNSIIESFNVTDKASSQVSVDTTFDYQYIYASQKYGSSSLASVVQDPLLDNVINQKYALSNGISTCINREVEFYHVLRSIDKTSIVPNTVYNYFINHIINSYTDKRDYIGTISYNITHKYLYEYYYSINTSDSSISIPTLVTQLLGLITKGVNITLINYIQQVLQVWKNSTYSDFDINPQYSISTTDNSANLYTTNIDYNANYVQNYSQYQSSYGDPQLLRAKYYVGCDATDYRPVMGFAYKYHITFSKPSTYTQNIGFEINSTYFDNNSPPIIQGSSFKDIYTVHLDSAFNKIQNDMEQLTRNNETIKNGMQYIYWRDINSYMQSVVFNLNTDLNSSRNIYYVNTVIMNHLPLALLHYYGQFMQYAMQTQYKYGALTNSVTGSINTGDNIDYTSFIIENEFATNNWYIYNNEPPAIDGCNLMFLGTDVRLDPSCSFHGKISLYSDINTRDIRSHFYLMSNDITYAYYMCPLCFRTIEFRRLFNIVLQRSLLKPSYTSPLPYVDDSMIKTLIGINYTLNLGIYTDAITSSAFDSYTSYFYRTEPIINDEVSKSYFTTLTEFVIHRIATIMFRYRRMIEHIIDLNDSDYSSYISSITPSDPHIGSSSQGTSSTTGIDRFNSFVSYINNIRTNNLKASFVSQMNASIAILTHTDNKETNFTTIKNIYDVPGPYIPNPGEASTYGPATSFIGEYMDLDTGFNSSTLVPNFVYKKSAAGSKVTGANLVRYQMYRGNVILWVLIQKKMIKIYNEFLNSVLDPRQISTTQDIIPDIFTEIYGLLKQNIITKYINPDGSIDYYRYRQTREYPLEIIDTTSNIANDFNDSICTKTITYCRQLMIFYNMLLTRYKKMSFLLDTVKNTSLNNVSSYYDFSHSIAKAYLSDAVANINDMKIISINPEKNQTINDKFYYLDTSDYFFVDPNTFRNLQIDVNNESLINDYNLFNYNNNYHLSQGFRFTKINDLMRMIGVHDDSIENYLDTYADLATNAYIAGSYLKNIVTDFNAVFNDNFSSYFTIDTSTHAFNNYEKYFYITDVVYNYAIRSPPTSAGFNYVIKLFRVSNNGIMSLIWYYYPTVSNILYDRYYTPVILNSIVNSNNTTAYFNFTSVSRRTFTNCLVTSPLIYLRDKLSASPTNKHNHTPNLITWENTFHTNNTSSSLTPSQNKDNETTALSSIYDAYQYFVGSYNYTDILTMFNTVTHALTIGPGSFGDFIAQYVVLLNNISKNISPAFDLDNQTYRTQQLQISLSIASATAVQNLNALIQNTIKFINTHNNKMIDLNNQINSSSPSTQSFVNTSFTSIDTAIGVVLSKIISLNMIDDINYVKQHITNTTTLNDINTLLHRHVSTLTSLNNTFIQTLNNQLNGILDAVKFMFINTTTDTRIFTPSDLWNLKNNSLLSNFSNYHDVIILILTSIISIITPNDLQPAQFLALTSGQDNFYNLSGTYVTQKLINNIYVESVVMDSRIETYNIMVQTLNNSIHSVLNNMSNLTVLSRYINSQIIMNEFFRYDFDIVITESNISNLKYANISYAEYKKHRSSIQYSSSGTLATYIGSSIYNQIINVLVSRIPQHAWARYLGYRLIEEVGLIIDGQQIDMQDGDLMLLLHKSLGSSDHDRGTNIMLGHIPEMYTISSESKPAMRLYIQLFLFFGRHYGNSLPLISMPYSDIKLKLKLRDLSELFYMEPGSTLKKPIKMKMHLLGNFIYLGVDERKSTARNKCENIMERFVSSGPRIHNINDIRQFMNIKNVLRIKYNFDDPCKYLLWKIEAVYPDTQPSDIISWDLANYRIRSKIPGGTTSEYIIDENSKIVNIANRTMIEFNDKTREQWKDNIYWQILQPYNKCLRTLDSGEALYSMCLFPSLLQPSGATNLSQIENMSLYFEINPDIINLMKTKKLKLKVTMWECSYNIFVSMSGFGALRFYATS